MGFFKGLFGRSEKAQPIEKQAPAIDFSDGQAYMQVRNMEDSSEKWELMLGFADRGNEIAQQDVGQYYLTGQFVARNDPMAEKYLLKARANGMTIAVVRLGQLYLRSSVDVFRDDMTEAEEEAADKEFCRRFQIGADYLVEALEGSNLLGVDHAIQIISGTQPLGYNTGDLRDFFTECIDLHLAKTVARIQEKTHSENSQEASNAWYTIGSLHMYGIHFEEDLDAAKECYEKSLNTNQHNAIARRALKNPLFED